MRTPSRHLDAARLGLAVGALLLLACLTLAWHYRLDVGDVITGYSVLVGGYLGAVGGSSLRESVGRLGGRTEAPTRPQDAPEP
jgi:hypothetical protein